jgi:L-alanine-DL-glutamate epimerase-like enolase superfamily enzyme
MADESMCTPHDAERLIGMNACRLFNVKLGKSGGLHHAWNILAQAERAGIGVQLGGFMESRLGMTAAAHLALASTAVRFCDFDTPLMFRADPVRGGIRYGEQGQIAVPDTIGLGAAVSEDFLENVTEI